MTICPIADEAVAWQTWQSVTAYLQALGEALDREPSALSDEGRAWLEQARDRATAMNPLAERVSKLRGGPESESVQDIP